LLACSSRGTEGKERGEGTYDNKSAFLGVVFDYYVYSRVEDWADAALEAEEVPCYESVREVSCERVKLKKTGVGRERMFTLGLEGWSTRSWRLKRKFLL
jgi:hypothetical protein